MSVPDWIAAALLVVAIACCVAEIVLAARERRRREDFPGVPVVRIAVPGARDQAQAARFVARMLALGERAYVEEDLCPRCAALLKGEVERR